MPQSSHYTASTASATCARPPGCRNLLLRKREKEQERLRLIRTALMPAAGAPRTIPIPASWYQIIP